MKWEHQHTAVVVPLERTSSSTSSMPSGSRTSGLRAISLQVTHSIRTTYRGRHECPEAQRKQRLLRRPEAALSTQSAAELLARSASTQYAQGTSLRAPGAGRWGVGGAEGGDGGGGGGGGGGACLAAAAAAARLRRRLAARRAQAAARAAGVLGFFCI